MKLDELVIVGPELTAIRIRFEHSHGSGTSISVMNHRPERRSYRTCGSLTNVPPGLTVITGAKSVWSLTLRPPRTPNLLNTLNRPFDTTSTCVGPTAPLLSGGTNPDSDIVGPRKFVVMLNPTCDPADVFVSESGGH